MAGGALQQPGEGPRRLGQGVVWLDADGVDGHREHLVVPDEHGELDQPRVVIPRAQLRPSGVAKDAVAVKLIGGAQRESLV